MDNILENREKTPLTALGEFGLISHLTKDIAIKNKTTILGVGDDAAIIDGKQQHQVVSTDLLVEGIHFDLHYSPLKHIGYKAIAANLSDIAAMNAKAEQVLVSIAVSNRFSVEAIDELYSGIYACCEKYGVDLVGGDTTSSVSGLFISITVLGYATKKKITRRSTAKENDLICVTGDLGAAYMGLLVLEREKKVFLENPEIQPELDNHSYILERQLKPEPRLDIVDELDKHGIIPTSMIDISDGLASEMLHICEQSEKGCLLYENKIPIDTKTYSTALEFGILPSIAALNGGEDYELLFTIKQKDYESIQEIENVTIIGYIKNKASGCSLFTYDNKSISLTAQGWDAYLKQKPEQKEKR
ncbi:MAG: thiamine-phosphate kinase [Bacteroidales bacterium]|jgi:thiamine-monophosphate kinase|nr:thiamine-phosphate kinase [Bacteroidales bacterium]